MFWLKAEKHWSEKLSVDEGEILLRWMLVGERSAQKETETIAKLLSEANVKPSMKILDFCCGYGRHSIRLAEKGYRVTGVDISEANIKYARGFAVERKVSHLVHFMVGDARSIIDLLEPQIEGFNAIIGILPAIGYYDEETDEDVLRQLHQLTVPGGVLILSLTNRDYHLERHKSLREKVDGSPAYEIHKTLRFDYKRSRMMETWRICQVVAQDLEHVSTVEVDRRLYSLHELIRLYEKTSWTYIKSFGNYQLEPVDSTKPMMIVIAAK